MPDDERREPLRLTDDAIVDAEGEIVLETDRS
jgi:hypothetical protein